MAGYQPKHSAAQGYSGSSSASPSPDPEKKPKGKVLLIILLCIIGVCALGAGVYALVHFVILAPPAEAEQPTAATVAEPTLAPLPTATPSEAAPTEPDYAALAEQKLATMSDSEKLYQLFIVSPEAITGVDNVTAAGDATKEAIGEYPVGGIMYTDSNFESADQTREMIANSQSYAKTPMFIAVDEEGGDVARVASKLGTASFDNMYTYKAQGEEVAHNNAQTIAKDISGLGFNLDFAPVADVFTNPDNTVIGGRAYSDEYEEAAKLVSKAVTGFSDGGVMSTLKHFPGHGNTAQDSHEGLAYVDAKVDELKSGELLPFKSGVEAGADMVMVGHLVVKDLDPDMPATLSSKVVPQLLREYLGYDGVVITDAMNMGAITNNYDVDTIVKGVFSADIDMILCPSDLSSYISAIEKAVENGEITQQQIDAKVKRILTLKFRKGVIAGDGASAPTEAASQPAGADVTEVAALNDPTE